MQRKNNFYISYYSKKTTSGQRFFKNLSKELSKYNSVDNPNIILFNISAPVKDIILAKLKLKKVIIRVDGIYFDKLSKNFISKFNFIFRILFRISLKFNLFVPFVTFLANFFNQNYGGFIRMILADKIIYQSEFSKKVYKKFFSKKKSEVILNGSYPKKISKITSKKNINIIAVHDSVRPSKRIDEIIKFIEWNNNNNKLKIYLNLIGYNRIFPNCIPNNIIDLIDNSNFINIYPRFNEYNKDVKNLISKSDMGITFSYRDACPNAIIELMSFGLPFIYYDSGGLSEIIGDAGIGLKYTSPDKYYTSHRFDNDFPHINYTDVLKAIIHLKMNSKQYEERVFNRFVKDLDMKVVTQKYIRALEI